MVMPVLVYSDYTQPEGNFAVVDGSLQPLTARTFHALALNAMVLAGAIAGGASESCAAVEVTSASRNFTAA